MLKPSGQGSLGKRYIYKIGARAGTSFLNLISQPIITRALGPRAYGSFSFLTDFAQQITGFFDSIISTGFYTKVSQRPTDASLLLAYAFYLLGTSILVAVIFGILMATGLQSLVWPEQTTFNIWLGLIYVLLLRVSQTFEQMVDAYGLTVTAEVLKIIHRLFSVIVLLICYFFYVFNLKSFFYYQYLITFALIAVLCYLLVVSRMLFPGQPCWRETFSGTIPCLQELYAYGAPLILYSLVSVVFSVSDRWLLQNYSGSEQQGYYALAYQIGTIAFLIANAMTPLLLREYSIAYAKGENNKLAELFYLYVPPLYSLVAYFSCFIFFNAQTVVLIIGGKAYLQATTAVALMSLFPIHQVYGQLSGTLFLATNRVGQYSRIGIAFMLIGPPISFYILAPSSLTGLYAGALGLVAKVVGLQIIWVNVQLYCNSRYLGVSFKKLVFHQALVLATFLSLSYLSTLLSSMFFQSEMLISFFISGIIYTVFVIGIIQINPYILGQTREEFEHMKKLLGKALGTK